MMHFLVLNLLLWYFWYKFPLLSVLQMYSMKNVAISWLLAAAIFNMPMTVSRYNISNNLAKVATGGGIYWLVMYLHEDVVQ